MRDASEMRPWMSWLVIAALPGLAACVDTEGGDGDSEASSIRTRDAATAPGDSPPPSQGNAGADASAGGGPGPATQPPRAPRPADAGAPPIVTPTCDRFRDLGGPDRRAAHRLGLFGSAAVVEGVLVTAIDLDGRDAARVLLERVWFGLGFLEGTEVLVPMADETFTELGAGSRVILGIGAPGQRPSASLLGTDIPYWEPLWAAVRAEDVCAMEPLVGYQSWKAVAVGVAKIVAQDAARTTFEVLETLAGELPEQLLENWPAEWELPYPGVGGDEYIISLEWLDDSFGLGAVVDIRRHDAVRRAEVERALADWRDASSPQRVYHARLQGAVEAARTTRQAWLYNRAELVANLEVGGKSPKCCATREGVFLASNVVDVWKGTAPQGTLITFLDALFEDQACGERFIHALSPVSTLTEDAPAFVCGDQPSVMSYAGATASRHTHRMPASPENIAAVAQWVQSDPPLYRLHPAEQAAAQELFARPGAAAIWSLPLEPEAALAAGPLVRLTIERVDEHADGHEVVVTTQFSAFPVAGRHEHRLKLFFAEGDPRLLQAGSTWLATIASVKDDIWSEGAAAGAVSAGELFIVPGLLLPVDDVMLKAATVLHTYPDPGVPVVNPP